MLELGRVWSLESKTIREFTHEELLASKYIRAKRKSIQKILFSFIYHKQKDGIF
jgi:hypothetical protein